jgi:hypothetical protein
MILKLIFYEWGKVTCTNLGTIWRWHQLLVAAILLLLSMEKDTKIRYPSVSVLQCFWNGGTHTTGGTQYAVCRLVLRAEILEFFSNLFL